LVFRETGLGCSFHTDIEKSNAFHYSKHLLPPSDGEKICSLVLVFRDFGLYCNCFMGNAYLATSASIALL
jgi:hypothetical protein